MNIINEKLHYVLYIMCWIYYVLEKAELVNRFFFRLMCILKLLKTMIGTYVYYWFTLYYSKMVG